MKMTPRPKKIDQAMKRLERIAKSPVLAEVARIAMHKRLRQRDLAKLVGVKASNLIGHFKSSRPHDATIDDYARAVGMADGYRTAVSGAPLDTETIAFWTTRLVADLKLVELYLTPGTYDEVVKVMDASDDFAHRALRAYMLAEYRGFSDAGNAGLPDSWSPGVKAFASVIKQRVDLAKRRTVDPSGHSYLELLWRHSKHDSFTEADRDLIVDVASALLRARGVDLKPLEEQLEHAKREIPAILQYHRLRDLADTQLKQASPMRAKHANKKKGKKS
jgi:hypothetical protein